MIINCVDITLVEDVSNGGIGQLSPRIRVIRGVSNNKKYSYEYSLSQTIIKGHMWPPLPHIDHMSCPLYILYKYRVPHLLEKSVYISHCIELWVNIEEMQHRLKGQSISVILQLSKLIRGHIVQVNSTAGWKSTWLMLTLMSKEC